MIVSIFWEMNCSFQLLFMNVLTFGGRKRGGGGGGGGGGAWSGDLMKNLETPGKTGRVGRHVVNIVVDPIN